ncbi:ABC transporter ATP-binding protein [Mesorhizobium sp. STM 4661]|uniref:oligopeptide/dipeptide ABC transporter ATP-binding protein n=1 Tax=Mesorhizobium sp. STM 4661 TaxID=1297570 RepID=UPI0002BDBF86|nr:ABC transporter ATP-binding protein [Mesorhizobium sp. STM 4661]CCV12205.1 oligopeptide transporter subunit; ATP-binding component of ABC superfamily [Mesorhizobium sp. STM 4661]
MSPLLAVEDLSVSFARGGLLNRLINPFPLPSFNVIDRVTLSLMPGETLGLVGESGSGKTTLARTILGLVQAAAGRIAFEGRDVKTQADFRAMRRRSAMMFQDPVASLSPRLRIGTLLTEPQVIQGVPMPDRRAAGRALLALVGLPASFVDRFPHELSGGQARRVCVARALAMKPHLLLADEPTAGLDVSVQGDVLNLIGELKRELGFAAIIVTHNLAMIRHVSDRLAIMYLGRLVETGPTQDVFSSPMHPYTATLIQSEPIPDPRRRGQNPAVNGEIPSVFRRPSGCEFHTRCPIARDRCKAEAPAYRKIGADRMVRCHFPLETGGQEREAFSRASTNQRGN